VEYACDNRFSGRRWLSPQSHFMTAQTESEVKIRRRHVGDLFLKLDADQFGKYGWEYAIRLMLLTCVIRRSFHGHRLQE
jgi:hypothetical protein